MKTLYYTAEFEAAAESQNLAPIPLGSLIRLNGICLTESGDDGKFKSL